MEIALTFNLKPSKEKIREEDKPPDYFSEFDSLKTVQAIASSLREKGHRVSLIQTDKNLFSFFKNHRFDFVFNISEGNGSRVRESEIPAILDILNIPYTGSGVATLAIALNKALTKKILKQEGIPTPEFQLFSHPHQELKSHLKFPLIVKPNREGSAKGISVSSVVNTRERLYEEIKKTYYAYKQEVLVEEFIEGKELTVGILENNFPPVLPILEIDFSSCKKSGEYFYSWRMKEYQGDTSLGLTPTFWCPARINRFLEENVKDVAFRAHQALDCYDLSRIDIRLSQDGIPYVLEVNPLPGLDPEESNFPKMAKAAGIEYSELISKILESAINRYTKINERRSVGFRSC